MCPQTLIIKKVLTARFLILRTDERLQENCQQLHLIVFPWGPLESGKNICAILNFGFKDRTTMSHCWSSKTIFGFDKLFFFAANIRIIDNSREFGSPGLGNIAWKERVDGWKVKQEKNVVPMSIGHAPSECREAVILMRALMY